MQIHDIQSRGLKSKKRIGRGGKRGTYSGRGQKGQRSRAGHRIRPAVRDLLIRIPKLRGFGNTPTSLKPTILNIEDLESFKGEVVDRVSLGAHGLVPRSYRGVVKLLGRGTISRPLSIKNDIVLSKSAREKIEHAGGKVLT